MQYRKDIDGLRGIAVLAVIFAHAKITGFAGGFIGVDIFFVISGFLITTITLQAIKDGTFSLVKFWERRIRRIIPAFYFTLLLCLPFAWWLLHYVDRFNFAQSMLYSLGFLSNIYFSQRVGYFDEASSLHPLIHTWSLSVEEQYYIIFPLLMLGLLALSKKIKYSHHKICLMSFIAIASISLIWSEYELRNNPQAAYYFLQYRAFELLVGAVASILIFEYPKFIPKRKIICELLGFTGAILIIYSVAAFDYATPFPGLYALIPTFGAALILMNNQGIISKILSLSPLRFVGKISYSAYLLHQPIIAFMWHFLPHSPKQTDYIFAIIATLTLATFSWKFIEQPFRATGKFNRKQIFSFMIIGTISFAGIALTGILSKGSYYIKTIENYNLESHFNKTKINLGLNEKCEESFTLSYKCATYQKGEKPELILWGDSFGMHLADMLKSALPNVKMRQATISACGPVLGAATYSRDNPRIWGENCINANNKVIEYIAKNPSIKYVVLGSIFFQYVGEEDLLLENGEIVLDKEIAKQQIIETIKRLKKLNVTPIIVSPPPQNGENHPRCLLKAKMFDFAPTICHIPRPEYDDYQETINGLVRELEEYATVIWLDEILCDKNICRTYIDDVPIFRDDAHLSHEGSAWIGTKINAKQYFPELLKSTAISKNN
jgi:peptidoglycan/LPS O-acetylase OafA/YrhL